MSSDKTVTIIIKGDDQLSPILKENADRLGDFEDKAEKAGAGSEKLGEGLDRAGAGAEKFGNEVDKAGEKAKQTTSKVDSFVSGLEKIASVTALLETAKLAMDFTDQGAALLGVRDSFRGLTADAKINGDTLLQSMRSASNGYVSDAELMKGANKALLNGGTELANSLPKLLEIAGASAKATGGDMKQMYADLVEGVTKAEPEILDNLGLAINLTQTYDTFGKTIGKAGTELTMAEKSTALLNEVMRQGDSYIAKVGATADGVGSSVNRLKTSFENLKNEVQQLAAIGLEQVLSGGTYLINQTNQMVLDAGASYTKYQDILRMTDQTSDGLSEAQYQLAQSFVASGMSSADASAAASGLADVQGSLEGVFFKGGEAAALSAEKQQALVEQALAVASTSPQAADAVRQLNDDLVTGVTDLEGYTTSLNALQLQTELHAQAAAEDTAMIAANADMMAIAAGVGYELTGSIWDMTDAQIATSAASIEAALAAEQQARYQEDLAYAANFSSDSAFGAAGAALYLSQAYGIEYLTALQLIAATRELNAARANRAGEGIGRAIGASVPRLAEKAPNYELGGAYNRPKKERAGGGGAKKSGGKSGKSEAVKEAEREAKELEKIQGQLEKAHEKYLDKAEKLDQDHIAKERKIWDDYYAKELAAFNKFNADKFKDELSFKDSLKGMNAEARAAMIAEERAAWAEAQAIAQAGNPQLADEYYKLKLEQITANQQRADEIAAIEQQITDEQDVAQRARLEAERAYLLALDAEHDLYDAEDLQKLKDGGNELQQERDRQLSEEETRYSDAQTTLKEEFGKSVSEIIDGSGKLKSAVTEMAGVLIGEFGRIAAAAQSVPTGGGGGEGEGGGEGGGGESAEGRAVGGDVQRGRPFVVGEEEPELFIPQESGTVLNQDQIRAALARTGRVPLSAARPTAGGGGSPSVTNNYTIAPTFPGSTAPRQEVQAASKDIEALVRRIMASEAKEMQKINRVKG